MLHEWAAPSDDELLQVRTCDLGLTHPRLAKLELEPMPAGKN